jgi:hypothetical protein
LRAREYTGRTSWSLINDDAAKEKEERTQQQCAAVDETMMTTRSLITVLAELSTTKTLGSVHLVRTTRRPIYSLKSDKVSVFTRVVECTCRVVHHQSCDCWKIAECARVERPMEQNKKGSKN